MRRPTEPSRFVHPLGANRRNGLRKTATANTGTFIETGDPVKDPPPRPPFDATRHGRVPGRPGANRAASARGRSLRLIAIFPRRPAERLPDHYRRPGSRGRNAANSGRRTRNR